MDDLLTTAEVAARLGCRTQTVLNHVARGILVPVGKLPTSTGTYLFHTADVDRLIAESTSRTGTPS